jgi:hypothetical protein
MMRNVILINATTVILHMTIVITHAAAHGILDVNMSLADYGFITLVILIAPVTAGILLGTRHRRDYARSVNVWLMHLRSI